MNIEYVNIYLFIYKKRSDLKIILFQPPPTPSFGGGWGRLTGAE
jgi:hypothetical protein